jgi:hypothetical protein
MSTLPKVKYHKTAVYSVKKPLLLWQGERLQISI